MNDAGAQSAAQCPAHGAGESGSSPGSPSATEKPVAATVMAAVASDSPPARCECPRCGYDLSGAAAAWNHGESASCPMRGTCSECGLELAWGELLNPCLKTPEWSYEHGHRRPWRCLVRTSLKTLRPDRLWRDLKMTHPIRGRRLILLSFLGMILVHTSLSLVSLALMAARQLMVIPTWRRTAADFARLALETFWPYNERWAEFILPSRPWTGSVPVVMSARTLLVWGWWIVMPFAYLLLPATLRRCRVRREHLVRIGAYSLVFASAGVLLAGAAPSVVQDPFMFVVVIINRAFDGELIDWMDLNRLDDLLRRWLPGASPFVCFSLVCVFWGCAASRYLKLPRPWLVAFVLTLVGGLLAMALLALWPGFLQRLFS